MCLTKRVRNSVGTRHTDALARWYAWTLLGV